MNRFVKYIICRIDNSKEYVTNWGTWLLQYAIKFSKGLITLSCMMQNTDCFIHRLEDDAQFWTLSTIYLKDFV